MTTKDESTGSGGDPPAEDPAEKFERFGAHEIPRELRQQLLQTELRRVDPERFEDTEPPRALAHAPVAPPAATERDETEPKVIVDGIPQPLARSLDPDAPTVPDARSSKKLDRLTRCLALGIALGVVLALVGVALASWAHDPEPAVIVIEPAPVEPAPPALDLPAVATPARATESAPAPAETPAPAARPAPVPRRSQTKPSAAPADSASAAKNRDGLFETLPRPPM